MCITGTMQSAMCAVRLQAASDAVNAAMPASRAVKTYRLGVIGGDGIGPEVTAAALRVLDVCEQRFAFRTARTSFPWSGAHYLKTGERLTPDKLAPIREQGAVLLGAIGHPDAPRGLIERDVIIGLRRGLDRWLRSAFEAGLDPEDVRALFETSMHELGRKGVA